MCENIREVKSRWTLVDPKEVEPLITEGKSKAQVCKALGVVAGAFTR
jgi:hypothetical protein